MSSFTKPRRLPVFEVRGCMADGAAYEEAVANTRQVIEEWSESLTCYS